jgi:hypothetical protein
MKTKKFVNISRVKKLLKYILMGMIVVIAMKYTPSCNVPNKEIIMIGAVSSIAFVILDIISPTIQIID